MLVLWKISHMPCGSLLHHGGTWEKSLALNGLNTAGVYVAGCESVPGLSLSECINW